MIFIEIVCRYSLRPHIPVEFIQYPSLRERKREWLFNQAKETTLYLPYWISRNDTNLNDFMMKDIHYVEVMSVGQKEFAD